MKKIFVILLAVFYLSFVPSAFGVGFDDTQPGCVIVNDDVYSLACAGQLISRIISIALIFSGVVILVYFMYGAILFILSRGDAKALQKAKNTIVYALLGGIVVVGAFVIVNIVIGLLGLPPLIDNFSLYQGN